MKAGVKNRYFVLFVTFFLVFIFHLILSGHGVYGDGNGYFSYTNALYFEKSLNFDPIYNHLENFHGKKYIFSRIFWDTSFGPYGVRENVFPIGTGVLWLPSFLIIKVLTTLAGLDIPKFDLLYEIGPGLTGIIFVLFGCYYLEKYLQNFLSSKIALFSVISILFTSNLIYYASLEPALSHQPAFFIVSFLLYFTSKKLIRTWEFALAGILSGILFMTRVADTILLVPVFAQILNRTPRKINLVKLVLTFYIGALPLFVSYKLMFGNFFAMPYITGKSGIFTLEVSRVFDFLLSPKRGLLLWNPVYLIAGAGLILWDNKHKKVVILSIAAFFFACSFWSANTSAGFGQRFAVGALPYFAIGLAYIAKHLGKKAFTNLIIVLLIWNALTLFQFYYNGDNVVRNENLTTQEFLKGQFTSPIEALKSIKNFGIKRVYSEIILD